MEREETVRRRQGTRESQKRSHEGKVASSSPNTRWAAGAGGTRRLVRCEGQRGAHVWRWESADTW